MDERRGPAGTFGEAARDRVGVRWAPCRSTSTTRRRRRSVARSSTRCCRTSPSRSGTPSSAHSFGRTARAALDDAHERVARRLDAESREIVFTSGGTEANNLALKGAAWAGKARGHRIVTSSIEHHAVGHTLRYLEKFGFEIVELPVDRYGRVDPGPARGGASPTARSWSRSCSPTTRSARSSRSREIAARVRAHKGVLLHVDAVQAAPYIDLRHRDARRGPRLARGPQVRGPEGRRGAVRPPRDAHPRAAARRDPGAPPPRRDRERRRSGRARRGLRPVRARSGPRPSRGCGACATGSPRRVLAVAGTELTGHPKEPPARPPLDHRPRHRRLRRSRSRSTSRASPARSARPARPARPRSATS